MINGDICRTLYGTKYDQNPILAFTMRALFILLGLTLALYTNTTAQTHSEFLIENGVDLNSVKPGKDFENIHVKKLASDSLSTSFLIWIRESVPLHKHEKHTENVYVLEGEGDMTVGDKTLKLKAGSYIFIPKNTPHSVVVDKSKGLMKVLSVQSPNFDGTDRVMIAPTK